MPEPIRKVQTSSTVKQALRERYLSAMGIQTWVPIDAAPGHAAQPAVPDGVEGVPDLPAKAGGDAAGLDWDGLASRVAACTACGLHVTRNLPVFSRGDRNAELLVVGEAPGAEEDRLGEPFVGTAGRLLDAMLRAMGYARGEVCIVNTLKCRPPGNRDPHIDELAACRVLLDRQIALVRPGLILAVGRVATQALLGTDLPLGKLRGRVHILPGTDIPLIATYHPAYLLRVPAEKRRSWQDLLMARAELRRREARDDVRPV